MISIMFSILLLICAIIFCVIHDYLEFLDKGKIDHRNKKPLLIKAIAVLPAWLLFAFNSEAKLLWASSVSLLMCCSWFWLFFDGLFSVIRGYNFWFTGSEDGKEDAQTDNLLQSVPLWLHIFIKVTLIVISTYVYIKLL